MHVAVRIGLVALLLVALAGFGVHYGATYDEHWPHPSGDQLAGEPGYDHYVGERVLLFGAVTAVDRASETIEMEVMTDRGDVAAELEVSGFTGRVEPGGFVQVYGVLEAEKAIHAEELVVVDRSPNSTRYKWVVSAIGGLLAAGYFLRHWRIDPRTLSFEPRADSVDSEVSHRES